MVFLAWFAGSFVVHALLLQGDYMQLASLYRPGGRSAQVLSAMILAHVLMSGAFVWIYARGVESRPWLAQGARYGIAVALLAIVPGYLIYFVVQPLPRTLVVKQILFDGVLR